VIGREQPDLLVASLPQANLLARLCAVFRPALTFVSFEHNTRLAKRVYELGYRLTSWRVDWSFADSATTMEESGRRLYLTPPRRATVVPLVSFDTPARREYVRLPDQPFRLVNAARFTATKNQAALIRAIAISMKAGRDVTLTLYGDGPERARCEALVAELGIGARVCFPGFVPDWWKSPADLFLLASAHEGVCIVALEAMHAGIPVAAPLVGGLRDYGTAETVGKLASLEPSCIADTIAAAMDGPTESAARVANAAQMVDRSFGADAVRSTYAEINQALVARAHAGRPGRRRTAARPSAAWPSV
jgi:glycosyltransferase involved in cell wall biosynthesis